jgi:hypothetical protein
VQRRRALGAEPQQLLEPGNAQVLFVDRVIAFDDAALDLDFWENFFFVKFGLLRKIPLEPGQLGCRWLLAKSPRCCRQRRQAGQETLWTFRYRAHRNAGKA